MGGTTKGKTMEGVYEKLKYCDGYYDVKPVNDTTSCFIIKQAPYCGFMFTNRESCIVIKALRMMPNLIIKDWKEYVNEHSITIDEKNHYLYDNELYYSMNYNSIQVPMYGYYQSPNGYYYGSY